MYRLFSLFFLTSLNFSLVSASGQELRVIECQPVATAQGAATAYLRASIRLNYEGRGYRIQGPAEAQVFSEGKRIFGAQLRIPDQTVGWVVPLSVEARDEQGQAVPFSVDAVSGKGWVRAPEGILRFEAACSITDPIHSSRPDHGACPVGHSVCH